MHIVQKRPRSWAARAYKVKVQFYPHKDFQEVLSQMTFVDMDALNENPEEEGDAVDS